MRAFFDIDTQIDFMFAAGALYGPGAEQVLRPVAALNRYAAENRIALISTVCAHPEQAREFQVWPPHCVIGTVGQQKPAATLLEKRYTLPNASQPIVAGDAQQIILEKDDLDMFSNPNLEPLLAAIAADECFVYGVSTEFCVKCAVMGLLSRRRTVSLVTDAIAPFSPEAGNKTIEEFRRAGGHTVSLAEVIR